MAMTAEERVGQHVERDDCRVCGQRCCYGMSQDCMVVLVRAAEADARAEGARRGIAGCAKHARAIPATEVYQTHHSTLGREAIAESARSAMRQHVADRIAALIPADVLSEPAGPEGDHGEG